MAAPSKKVTSKGAAPSASMLVWWLPALNLGALPRALGPRVARPGNRGSRTETPVPRRPRGFEPHSKPRCRSRSQAGGRGVRDFDLRASRRPGISARFRALARPEAGEMVETTCGERPRAGCRGWGRPFRSGGSGGCGLRLLFPIDPRIGPIRNKPQARFGRSVSKHFSAPKARPNKRRSSAPANGSAFSDLKNRGEMRAGRPGPRRAGAPAGGSARGMSALHSIPLARPNQESKTARAASSGGVDLRRGGATGFNSVTGSGTETVACAE